VSIATLDNPALDAFEKAVGNFAGLKIADVGSGPGHYALEFARRGAMVTCVDISAQYLKIAKLRIDAEGLEASYALGYIDNIGEITGGGFDAVFSNVAWCYCMNDYTFARKLLAATRSGGTIFIRQVNEDFQSNLGLFRKLTYFSNRVFGVKVGHTFPPRGRIAAAFNRAGGCEVVCFTDEMHTDVVIVTKNAAR
jgi:2-polyprenyl-3-methyl-5-hydroxy-6-metoxy-1,4-benzoquinol methylase